MESNQVSLKMTDSQTVDHELVILGNGFDKACGLHSSFSEFFTPRMQLVETVMKKDGRDWIQPFREHKLTAWDLILLNRKDLNEKGVDILWCDVESAIADTVEERGVDEPVSSSGLINVASIQKYFNFMQTLNVQGLPSAFMKSFSDCLDSKEGARQLDDAFSRVADGVNVNNHIVEAFIPFIQDELDYKYGNPSIDSFDYYETAEELCPDEHSEKVGVLLEATYSNVRKWDVNAVRAALLEELHALEKQFNKYLSNDVAQCAGYRDVSAKLLKRIVDDSSGICEGRKAITLLNFNYTEPSKAEWTYGSSRIEINDINVHGRLVSDLIFGIDGSDRLSNASVVRFTKTFRLLELDAPSIQSSITYPRNGAAQTGAVTTAIKVFGHSLARADYSYFQSIFDSVDLYAGSVRLCFYYTNFKPGALDELLVNVANLLDAYGKSMDNKSHGKNLMHKLLLERRISVKALAV